MTMPPSPPERMQPDWLLVEPPPELWPLVVASTIERTRLRRQVLRSLRVPLAIAAIVLIVVTSATTVWVVRQLSSRVHVTAAPGSATAPGVSRSGAERAPTAPHAPRAPRPGQ